MAGWVVWFWAATGECLPIQCGVGPGLFFRSSDGDLHFAGRKEGCERHNEGHLARSCGPDVHSRNVWTLCVLWESADGELEGAWMRVCLRKAGNSTKENTLDA
ncbi:MAG: hypothetical protein QG656_1837 [Candidatus Hydrogenedentes bacterium]|nr:hypothetical protein [Candidatus Hydrogenedentota bacterium]